jgi:ABC-type Na+ transport system ATPase subunit NatA
MAENTIQAVLKIIETVVAPSIGDLKAHAITTDKNFEMVDQRFQTQTERMDFGFKTLSERMEFQFKALMSEMQTVRAQIEASNLRQYSELRERVAVLESQIRPKQ